MITRTAAAFAPVVQNVGPVTLSLPLITRTAVTFTPRVERGAVGIALVTITRTATPSAPTITWGAAVVALPLLDRTAIPTAPTIEAPFTDQGISLAMINRTAVAAAPTVVPAALAVTLPLITQTAIATTPSVARLVTLTRITRTAAPSAPTVARGAVTVALPLITRTASATAPAVNTITASLQSLIDATTTGGTLNVPAGIYRESVTVSRAMTINGAGAVIDGRNSGGTIVRNEWMHISANDVTITGFTMRYAGGGYSDGGITTAAYIERLTIDSCDLSYAYNNVIWDGTRDSVLSNCDIHNATHLGLRIAGPAVHTGLRNQIVNNRIYDNNIVGEPDPNADAAGMKATGQDDLLVDGNECYGNDASGLWLDVSCLDCTISNNNVHDNTGPGIMDETSTGTTINGNAVWRNGFAESWGWGAGILVSSSKDATVYDNVVAWNQVGISVIDQDRGDSPGVTGNYVHDNIVTEAQMAAGQDHFGLFWAYDYLASHLYDVGSNNRGLDNQFFYADPDGSLAAENSYPRFIWDGYHFMATFVTVPGGTGSSYMTLAAADAALTTAGIPLVP